MPDSSAVFSILRLFSVSAILRLIRKLSLNFLLTFRAIAEILSFGLKFIVSAFLTLVSSVKNQTVILPDLLRRASSCSLYFLADMEVSIYEGLAGFIWSGMLTFHFSASFMSSSPALLRR